jgi:outer membrane protein assembly factor BamB
LILPQAGVASQHRLPALRNGASWRGPHKGSAAQGAYLVKWDSTNVLWNAPLPGKGCSTPIVWAKQIVLTAPVGGLDAALAFDWAGKPF